MDRNVVLLGQNRIGASNISDILLKCELPEFDFIHYTSFNQVRRAKLEPATWLIIIHSRNFNAIEKFLAALPQRDHLIPIIIIHSVQRRDLEVLLSLGACDVIPPEIVSGSVLTQSILSAVERKRIEADLTSRDAIMQAVNFAAEVFLLHFDWDSRIDEVLTRFGQATHADKVCIYKNLTGDESGLRSKLHAGWASTENFSLDAVQTMSTCESMGYATSRWEGILKSDEIIIGSTHEFPSEEQPALHKRHIVSLAVIPIFSDHLWWGFITFEHCQREKQWTKQEEGALRTAARIFGAGISRVDAETRLTHLATHDFLTNLPNRMLLEDRFEQAIARAGRSKKKFGVIALDLDKFKLVNDTYGHPFGDRVLVEIAWRLSETVRTSDTCARVGGDEFTVLAEGINNKNDLMRVMEKLSLALAEPIQMDGNDLKLTASMGASLYPNHGGEMEALMKAADVALYQVKDGYSGCRIYSSAQQISFIEE